MRRIVLAVVLFLMLPRSAAAVVYDCVFLSDFSAPGVTAEVLEAMTPDAVTPAERDQFVTLHNCVRRSVNPKPAVPIPLVHWDNSIAAQAQAYANNCVYAHSGAAGLGENIYASAPLFNGVSAVMQSWSNEASSYDYSANSCSGVCGHYTQVVWRTSVAIGCGVQTCTTGTPFGPKFPIWAIAVCNYSPAGNNGSRPY